MKFILLLILITNQYLFAIVSITPVEIAKKAGFHGNFRASLETKRGNTEKDNYKASAKIAYDNNTSYVTWAEVSGEYGESTKIEDTNKLYVHVRHIQALSDEVVRFELLGQIQSDKFKLINDRTLGGAGLRFKAFELFENSKGYIGIGGFYEYINYTSNDPVEKSIRLNNYFTYTADLNKKSSFSYTMYYQPIAIEFKDYIQSHHLDLKLNVFKELYLNFRVAYNRDSKPPVGLENYDFYQETAFIFEF